MGRDDLNLLPLPLKVKFQFSFIIHVIALHACFSARIGFTVLVLRTTPTPSLSAI